MRMCICWAANLSFMARSKKPPTRLSTPNFPVLKTVGKEFTLNEEWYSLKDFSPDIHVLTVIDAPSMKGREYARPAYPTTWARKEEKGRVWYSALGHREDM